MGEPGLEPESLVKLLSAPYGTLLGSFSPLRKVKALVSQLCPTLCDPMDCSPPGSSVHEILQASILEWVAIPFSRGSSQPRGRTWVSCIAGRFFTVWAPREARVPITSLGDESRPVLEMELRRQRDRKTQSQPILVFSDSVTQSSGIENSGGGVIFNCLSPIYIYMYICMYLF